MEPLTSPLFHHRRKPAILSTSNGLSFSGKDDYGDLLSGGSKKTKFRRGVVVEDYGEIFGGGVAGGGRGSSIPVGRVSIGAPMKACCEKRCCCWKEACERKGKKREKEAMFAVLYCT